MLVPNFAVVVDLHPQSLDVVCAVGSPSKVGQVELNLIPAIVQSHRHCADKGLVIKGSWIGSWRLGIVGGHSCRLEPVLRR